MQILRVDFDQLLHRWRAHYVQTCQIMYIKRSIVDSISIDICSFDNQTQVIWML